MANLYYSGQGRVAVAVRDGTTGAPLGFEEVGNVPDLSVSVSVTKFEHKESQTGNRAVDLSLVQEKQGTFSMTLESLTASNLAMAFWGTTTPVVAGSVTGESVTVYLGKYSQLANIGVSNFASGALEFGTSEDDLVNSLNGYVNEATGSVFVFSDAEQTTRGAAVNITDGQVLSVDYDYAGATTIDGFIESNQERYLRFEGLNTIDGKAVVVDIFKAQLDPLTDYGLINEELGSLTVTGTVLYDELQPGNSKFFRQRNLA